MDLGETLGIVASLLYIISFVVYNKQILNGENAPNIATWAIWAFESLFGLASYFIMSGDWVKSLLPAIGSFFCILTFGISLCRGGPTRLNKCDIVVLIIGLSAILVWWQLNSATYANLIIQACITIGFIPTFVSVLRFPQKEKPFSWFLWGFAYLIGTIVVLLRWNNQYQDLVYYINCTILHLVVGALALRKNK